MHQILHNPHHFGWFGISSPCFNDSSSCSLSLCFFPWKCCFSNVSFMHVTLHNSHHCGWFGISSPCCKNSSCCSFSLCFFPCKCSFNKVSFMHVTLHNSQHWSWFAFSPPYFLLSSNSSTLALCFLPLKCCSRLKAPEHCTWQILQNKLSIWSLSMTVPWDSPGGSGCRYWRQLVSSFRFIPERFVLGTGLELGLGLELGPSNGIGLWLGLESEDGTEWFVLGTGLGLTLALGHSNGLRLWMGLECEDSTWKERGVLKFPLQTT